MRVLYLGGGALGDAVLLALANDESCEVVEAGTEDDVFALATTGGPFDWLVSAGWRSKLPDEVLKVVGNTCNVHPSLLPWGRGANPNVWMIVDGEPAGVSIHRMTDQVDGGPIFVQSEVSCLKSDTGRTLYERLTREAGLLFGEYWPEIRDGQILPVEQPRGGSVHTFRDFRELCEIDMEEEVTWGRALDVLRALSFAPFANLVIDERGEKFAIELNIERLG